MIFFFATVLRIGFGSTESLKKECDIIVLFKEGKYKEIIDSTRGIRDMGECEKLLVAKSFERLGLYNQSIKVLKELYLKKTPLCAFTAYFIARNYDKLNDNSNAFKWYRNVLTDSFDYPENFGGNTDHVAITNASLFKLIQLGLHERKMYGLIEKLLKRSSKDLIEAQYALALLYHKAGVLQKAVDNYISILNTEDEFFRKLVMEQITKDFRVIRIIGERGISKTDLVHLCIKYELYSGALLISYQLPYSMYVSQLRAYCFFKIGDYQSSVVMYNEYFSEYKDPEALVKIAYSYYYQDRKERAYFYLQKYLQNKDGLNNISADAFYLKLILERDKKDITLLEQESELFVKKYKTYSNIDRYIQNVFYYILQKNEPEMAVTFLKNTYSAIRNPRYKAWSLFILGIYEDELFLRDAIILNPGSYYYYSASENLKINRNILKKADRFFNQDKVKEALDIYIQLFSAGIQESYTKSKIVEILSEVPPYEYLFELDQIRSGKQVSILYELFTYGLYDELEDVIHLEFFKDSDEEKILFYYIMSKISYELMDIKNGLIYAERMMLSIGKKYFLFYPEDILKLLYPDAHRDIIQQHLKHHADHSDYPEFLNSHFIMAIIREESRYDEQARSRRGALGLMQIMPDTADWIKNKKVGTDNLFDPSQNIEIGVLYLEYLVKRFSTEKLVLAAYNGGPTNVDRWLQANNVNEQRFIEQIPFQETRNYIKKVIVSYNMYRTLYSHP